MDDSRRRSVYIFHHQEFLKVLAMEIPFNEDEYENGRREDLAGFGDIDETGYLDRLYVHRDFQGMGVGTALCQALEQEAARAVRQAKPDASVCITTHASITARPFFEARGYRVQREQQVERKGVLLTNYIMEKRV